MDLPKTLPRFLCHFARRYWIAFTVMLLANSIWALNESVFPYFIKVIVNTLHKFQGDPSGVFTALTLPIVGIVGLWTLMEISVRVQGLISLRTMPRFRANIRKSLLAQVKQHSNEYFASHFAGSIANKISDLPRSSEIMISTFLFSFMSILMGFFIACFMMWQASHLFTLILLAWFCLHMGITLSTANYCNRLSKQHSEAVSTLSGKIVDTLSNILTVHLFARNAYEQEYFQQFQNDEIKQSRIAAWAVERVKMAQGVLGILMIFAMVYTLIKGWIQGWVTLGDFAMITMLSFNMLGLIWFMSFQVTNFFREIGTAKAALDLIAIPPDIVDAPGAKPLVVTKGEIRLENISFAYAKQNVVFKNESVTIPGGQKVGLVGFSGAGKTTFVNLILRFYSLDRGRILIDGQDIAQTTQDSLREQIAMIPQDPTLFHRSLLENIRYGRLGATDEEVLTAAKHANCNEFIEAMTEGYETLVGERGIKLSGGQRQRIAIARAILKNAPILIMDEATSSLDSITETYIHESLKYLMQGRTTVVIAHRLSTLSAMNRILVFDNGKVIEEGTSQELLAQKGHYAKLWNMQANGFLPG